MMKIPRTFQIYFRYFYCIFGISYIFGVENVFFLLLKARRNVVTSCLLFITVNQADESRSHR